jgi:hypothetical protein
MQQVRIHSMSNGSEKELRNQEEVGDEPHQLELQESHIQDEKYDEVEE